jgi:hypothetical protein
MQSNLTNQVSNTTENKSIQFLQHDVSQESDLSDIIGICVFQTKCPKL